jgi:hypothetical protein
LACFLERSDLLFHFARASTRVRISLLADDYTIVIALSCCRLIRTELNSIELQVDSS